MMFFINYVLPWMILWLLVAVLSAFVYKDVARYKYFPSLEYTDALATTLFWPVLLPIMFLKFALKVIQAMPAALKRIWSA